jgi:acetyl esterase
MFELDQDAAQLLAVMQAAGRPDIVTMTPQAVREAYAAYRYPPGRAVHAVRDFAVPGPHGDIPVRLYRASDAAVLPLLVWFHGGGMVIGSLASADWIARELCVAAGCAVLSVDYRLAPEHPYPVPVEDAFAAAAWVCGHAAEIGADPARIVVGGDSAGGTCAAVAALLARERGGAAFCGQLLIYPGTGGDLDRPSVAEFADAPILTRAGMEWFRRHYFEGATQPLDHRAAPARAASHAGLPPACVLVAAIDPLRDSGEAYALTLAQHGVLTAFKRYAGVYHGFFTMGPYLARTREAVADAASFLRSVFEAA